MEDFVHNCLGLFKTANKSRIESASEACSLAIHGLVHLHKQQQDGRSQKFLLQAATLSRRLEKDMEQSEHQDRVALLLSIRLHMYIGLSPVALAIYPKVRVKEVLNDTLSHHLFSRVSTQRIFRPQLGLSANNSEVTGDPRNQLEMILDNYRNSLNKIDLYKGKRNDYFQYDQAIEIYDMERDLKSSIVRRMAILDFRRICRLRAEQPQRLDSLQESMFMFKNYSSVCEEKNILIYTFRLNIPRLCSGSQR